MSRKQKTKLKILMPAAEIAPFAKAGGLADVVGSLPPALKKLGCDVRLIMPLYEFIDKKKYKLKRIYSNIEIPSGHKIKIINLWQANLPGTRIPIYFIEAPGYFTSQSVYKKGGNSERFLFFSLACLYITPIIKFKPDIVHCHDVHTALIPDILKNTNYLFLKGIRTLFTIHNFKYQGQTEIEVLSTGNLTKDSLKSLSRDAQDGDINFMVQGILNADLINTVSKTYAKEITTPAHGYGLDNIIRKRKKDLFGVLNGIDTKLFDPATDKFIRQRYSLKSLNNKARNKLYLQKKLGLPQDKKIAVVGFINRLVSQKGLELLTPKLCQLACQFVCLGTGWEKYEKHLKDLARRYPNKFSAQIIFDIKLAQQIYAGADMFLIPSRFEPCGLGQMIAMRYGTVPVVRATGGLADTVDAKVGFKFKKFSPQTLYNTLEKALGIYYHQPKKWRQLQVNGMKKDFSWGQSAKEYLKLYQKLMIKS